MDGQRGTHLMRVSRMAISRVKRSRKRERGLIDAAADCWCCWLWWWVCRSYWLRPRDPRSPEAAAAAADAEERARQAARLRSYSDSMFSRAGKGSVAQREREYWYRASKSSEQCAATCVPIAKQSKAKEYSVRDSSSRHRSLSALQRPHKPRAQSSEVRCVSHPAFDSYHSELVVCLARPRKRAQRARVELDAALPRRRARHSSSLCRQSHRQRVLRDQRDAGW